MTSKEIAIDVDPESDSQDGVQHLEAQHADIVVDQTLVKGIVRKYDLYLLIFFVIINLFCFIDRVNIGNVRLLGLAEDLKLNVGLRYNIALMCLFVPYCVVELPANILCKRIGGHIWIPFLVSAFAIITTLTSVVQNRQGLYAARFVLGLVEGGVSPGLIWLLSQLQVPLISILSRNADFILATNDKSLGSGRTSMSPPLPQVVPLVAYLLSV